MIFDELQSWDGKVEVDDRIFDSINHAQNFAFERINSINSIILHTAEKNSLQTNLSTPGDMFSCLIDTQKLVRITVRPYMTKKASASFDFMARWNNDIPMPLCTMVGTVEKQTSGMVYMHLYGDVTSETTSRCLKCGRPITNTISQFFGMGPECGQHNYINPFDTEEELKLAVLTYRQNYLNKIKWSGWVVKSAILEIEEVIR